MKLPRVLLISPEGLDAGEIAEELGCLGFETILVSDPDVAMSALGASEQTAIIAVESMPGLPARAVIRAVELRGAATPVIVSGPARSVDRVIGLFRSGAADYIRVPEHLSDLGGILDRLSKARPASGGGTGPSVSAPSGPDPAPVKSSLVASRPPSRPGSPRGPIAQLVEELREGRVELPAFAPIGLQVQAMMERLETPVQLVVDLVSQDPVVSGCLLQLANSAELRGRTPAADLRTACVRLGNRRVLSLAQQILLRDHFRFGQGVVREVVQGMWENSVATAHIARRLGELCGAEDLDGVYLAGLLHNIGELVLLKLLVEIRDGAALKREDLHAIADELARHHELVGRLLLASWDAPKGLQAVAGGHHVTTGRTVTAARKLSAICLTAWTMACERGFPYLPGHERLAVAPHLRKLGVSSRHVAGLADEARQWVDSHTDAHVVVEE